MTCELQKKFIYPVMHAFYTCDKVYFTISYESAVNN